MKKLTPVPDLLPDTAWNPRMHQGSTETAYSFFTIQPMAYMYLKHGKQFKVRNTIFAQNQQQCEANAEGKLQEDINTARPDSDTIQGEDGRIQRTPRAVQKTRRTR